MRAEPRSAVVRLSREQVVTLVQGLRARLAELDLADLQMEEDDAAQDAALALQVAMDRAHVGDVLARLTEFAASRGWL